MARFTPSTRAQIGDADAEGQGDEAPAVVAAATASDATSTNAQDTSATNVHSTGIRAIGRADVHRITSGQVVLDLQSAVKELVENALDAGSTSIEIRFRNFGLDGFEVIDNGTGIQSDDYATVALKHHTSKIEDFHDLAQVTTFGFRGEALASLCALAQVTILTATKAQAPMGTLLEFSPDGSLRDSSKKLARQRGCTVTVGDLFHSLPVRRREFERNSKREYGKVQSLLQAYALISRGVRWSVVNLTDSGKRRNVALAISSAASGDWLFKNFASVFGAKSHLGMRDLSLQIEVDTASHTRRKLKQVVVGDRRRRPTKRVKRSDGGNDGEDQDEQQQDSGEDEDDAQTSDDADSASASASVQITGLISLPSKSSGRTSSDRQFFYINGRPWDNPKVSRVFNDVFRSFNHTTSTHVPVVIADFQLATDGYDVNVSPDKRTIFLHHEVQMLEALRTALEEMYAPSRGTFAVNGPSATQHTQTKLGYTPSQRRRDQDEDEDEGVVQLSEMTEDSDGGGVGDDNDDNNPDGDDDDDEEEEEEETARDELMRQPDEIAAAEPSSQDHTTGDDEDKDDGPDDDEDDDVIMEAEEDADEDGSSRAPAKSTSRPTTSTTATTHAAHFAQPSLPASRRPVASPPSRPNARTSFRSARPAISSSTTTRPMPKQSIASMLSGFARPGASVELSTAKASHGRAEGDDDGDGDGDGDGDENQAEYNDDSDDDAGDDAGDDNDDDDEVQTTTPLRDTPSASTDEASALRSKHISTVPPSSDTDYADEERQENLNRLDERGERDSGNVANADTAAPSAATSAATACAEASSANVAAPDAVVIDLDKLRKRIRRPTTTRSPLYVNPGAVAARARKNDDEDRDTSPADLAATAGVSTHLDDKDGSVTSSLQRTIRQEDFASMEILGQFNLGFIIVRRRRVGAGDEGDDDDDLFIVDQHASDEKFNFETLQTQTRIRSQRLIAPRSLELSATDELVALQHIDSIRANGFDIDIDENALAGSRVKLISQPVSQSTVFGVSDLEELLYLLRGVSADSSKALAVRCTKARAMFASRACRKSVMIGTALNQRQMTTIVRHMGEIQQPWNCPHGRPTMRHLACLRGAASSEGKKSGVDWSAVLRL